MQSKRLWWQQIKQHSFIASGIIIMLIAFIFAAYRFSWSGTRFLNKTLWVGCNFSLFYLRLPLVYFCSTNCKRVGRKRPQNYGQKMSKRLQLIINVNRTLKEYFEKMSELLLHENLRRSEPDAEVRKIARVWTLTVLPRLDPHRKRSAATIPA